MGQKISAKQLTSARCRVRLALILYVMSGTKMGTVLSGEFWFLRVTLGDLGHVNAENHCKLLC